MNTAFNSTSFSVPDYPPKDITVFSQGTDTVQVDWSPVPPEYTNGEVLGYKVLYSDVKDTSRVNSSLVSPKETHSKIEGLKTNTNYSFQVLAFTAKGNGAKSAAYFARTLSGIFKKSILSIKSMLLYTNKSRNCPVLTIFLPT